MAKLTSYRIEAAGQALVCHVDGDAPPALAWFGEASAAADFEPRTLPLHAWSPGRPVPPCLFPQYGFGFLGEAALAGVADGGSAETDLRVLDATATATALAFRMRDAVAGLELELEFELDAASGVLRSAARLANTGRLPFRLQRLAALSMPLPDWATHAWFHEGAPFHEGRLVDLPVRAARLQRSTRGGRPGHGWTGFVYAGEPGASDEHGRVLSAHLAYSGNVDVLVEGVGDVGRQLQLAEWLAPGEIVLAPGQRYATPDALITCSTQGFNGTSQRLHRYLRARSRPRPRPAQLNTWEAVYFDTGEADAIALADASAELGLERFVLDDGWFAGRDDDTAGLGDWVAHPRKFPRGLGPLIEHVRARGLSFGLWMEPEMVNPNSALLRAHPDWALGAPDRPAPLWRNQLVLDLTRPEVAEHVYQSVHRLLGDHAIDYVKWDCNRELFPAGNRAHRQVQALYQLLARLVAAHPEVCFESCASGGGRLDYGILRYADRLWISDNTDPIARTAIQRAASRVFPLEFLGAHVGSAPNPTTERGTPMPFRCLVSLFGHFGVEADLRRMPDADRVVLKAGIALYKQLRDLIAGGTLYRIDEPAPGLDAQLIESPDGSRLLLRVLQVDGVAPEPRPRIRLEMLDDAARYQVCEHTLDGAPPAVLGDYSGSRLRLQGLDAAPLFATSGRLFELVRR